MSPDGFIEGRASQTSNEPFPFTVVVKDASGASAAKDLQIRVVKPASMHIATTKLVQAYLKKEYRQPLSAIGGAAPYRWSVVRFQRLAQTATELPGEELPSIPENFGILVQKEGDQAVLRGMPTQAGLYALTLYVQDRDGASDTTTLTLNISYDLALAITTTVLPDAFVNQPYTVRLSHNAGSGVTVDFAEACVQQVESTSKGYVYKCVPVDPLQKLPGGLLLGNDGTISGAPTAPVGQEAVEPGVEPPPVIHSFLVKATDSSGRIDVRSLSIKIRTPPVEKTGCSGTGLGPAALALLGLAGLARRRRS